MTGLEMIQIAENDYDGPVIIISALSDTDTILKAVDMGIVKIHSKANRYRRASRNFNKTI